MAQQRQKTPWVNCSACNKNTPGGKPKCCECGADLPTVVPALAGAPATPPVPAPKVFHYRLKITETGSPEVGYQLSIQATEDGKGISGAVVNIGDGESFKEVTTNANGSAIYIVPPFEGTKSLIFQLQNCETEKDPELVLRGKKKPRSADDGLVPGGFLANFLNAIKPKPPTTPPTP
ncbi:MAG: hypothetical protein WCP18_01015 [bacterium]